MKNLATASEGISELREIIAGVSFPCLVSDTHTIDRQNKTFCPFHQDSSPSCHIYDDGFHCYACGTHGDALDWYQQVHNLSKANAIKELSQRAGTPTAQRTKPVVKPRATCKSCDSLSLEPSAYAAYVDRVGLLKQIPKSLEGRGFLLEDLWNLGIVQAGEDTLTPILNPRGEIVRVKRRHFQGTQRYSYTTSGTGTPAWCSPNFLEHDMVLICEGELNAMITWCVLPSLAVMGVAGTNGCLWLDTLKGKAVYCYADGDAVGQAARDRWAQAAHDAGASKVFKLEPLPDPKDFCEVAGQQGRDALREVLSCL
jgi:DNA primase